MKKLPSVRARLALIVIFILNLALSAMVMNESREINSSETKLMNNYLLAEKLKNGDALANKEVSEEEKIVFDGMNQNQLADKLERNLKSTLSGYGKFFAKYSVEYEVDPYIALAIVLHETGCSSGTCSYLTSACNNIGGMKGPNGCGSYAKFNSLELGIEAFFRNLSNNYFKIGLKTPEEIGKKYAESTTWASKIRYYVNVIKNS